MSASCRVSKRSARRWRRPSASGFDLGNRQWDIPRLRELLSEVLPHRQTVEAFEVKHTFETIGEKIMLISARTLSRAGNRPSLILVSIEDVTERRHSEWLLEHQRSSPRRSSTPSASHS